MRRGADFERMINGYCEILNMKGIHAHKNHANRNYKGVYLAGEPFDYEIIYNGQFYCFDAKICHASKWRLSNTTPGQVKALKDCADNGAIAFFLVYFAQLEYSVKFDIYTVLNVMKAGSKVISPDSGEKFNWEYFTCENGGK